MRMCCRICTDAREVSTVRHGGSEPDAASFFSRQPRCVAPLQRTFRPVERGTTTRCVIAAALGLAGSIFKCASSPHLAALAALQCAAQRCAQLHSDEQRCSCWSCSSTAWLVRRVCKLTELRVCVPVHAALQEGPSPSASRAPGVAACAWSCGVPCFTQVPKQVPARSSTGPVHQTRTQHTDQCAGRQQAQRCRWWR
jgi:hypothetical protein